MKKIKQVYLDGAANTFLDKRVFKAMKPYLLESFQGNSFAIHKAGINSMEAVETSRGMIAKALGVEPSEVYFTSGATESNNWVLKSLALNAKQTRNEIIISSIEHSSVLSTIPTLKKLGMKVILVDPTPDGRVGYKNVIKYITNKTLLVCVMAVNNETGVLNTVESIARYAHREGALMMSDCTQLFSYGDGFMNIGKNYPHVDYITFSGHKIYGPTGVGCLICRNQKPLVALLDGGSQEQGKRGGTHNVAGIVGLGAAVALLRCETYKTHYEELFNYLKQELSEINKEYHTKIYFNAKPTHMNIANINCTYIGKKGADVSGEYTDFASYLSLLGIECSAGAACEASDQEGALPKPSHVLTAIGVPENEIRMSIRLSFTKKTTKKDIKRFISVLTSIVKKYIL